MLQTDTSKSISPSESKSNIKEKVKNESSSNRCRYEPNSLFATSDRSKYKFAQRAVLKRNLVKEVALLHTTERLNKFE